MDANQGWQQALQDQHEALGAATRPILRMVVFAVPVGSKVPRVPPEAWHYAFETRQQLLAGGLMDLPLQVPEPANLCYVIYAPGFWTPTTLVTPEMARGHRRAQEALVALRTACLLAGAALTTVEGAGFEVPCHWHNLVACYLHHAWADTRPKQISAPRMVAYAHPNGLEGARIADHGSRMDNGSLEDRLFPHLFYAEISDLVRDIRILLKLLPGILAETGPVKEDADGVQKQE